MTSDAAKKWGMPGVLGTMAVGAAMLGVLGLMFGRKDKRMENLKKIRDALRFAADAAVPRIQVEATLVLAEVAHDLLKEAREQAAEQKSAGDLYEERCQHHDQRDAMLDQRFVETHAETVARCDAERELLLDMRRLLRKMAGEPEPEAPAEPPPSAPLGETGVEQ